VKKLTLSSLVFAVLLQLFAYYTLFQRTEPFMYQFYIMAWWSYIIFLDVSLALETGCHFVLNRRLFSLVTISVAFWCMFELFNLRMQNWFYINMPSRPAAFRFGSYFLAFGTVIPGILLTKEQLLRLLPEVRIPRVSKGAYRVYAIPLGLLCLVLSLAFPRYLFGLSWVFLIFIIDGYNYRKGYRSFMRDLEQGALRQFVAAALAGMVCGFLWEFWNYWSITKWVYTVPFFEEGKVFEMPAPGYIGFALFGLETIAFVNLLEESRFLEKPRWGALFLALVFAVVSFFLIERYTVFSHAAPIERLSFLTEETRSALERKGVKTSYAIDPRLLNARERQSLAFMHLKGLGIEHMERLQEHGVATIGDLATLDERQLSAIIGEGQMRRVRVYLRAARVASAPPP
jgi:hypothetical protein